MHLALLQYLFYKKKATLKINDFEAEKGGFKLFLTYHFAKAKSMSKCVQDFSSYDCK